MPNLREALLSALDGAVGEIPTKGLNRAPVAIRDRARFLHECRSAAKEEFAKVREFPVQARKGFVNKMVPLINGVECFSCIETA